MSFAAWPVVAILLVYRIAVEAAAGGKADDFSTVYYAIRRHLAGIPVYSEDYSTVDPHYLYSPGATLLLTPLGWSDDWTTMRLVFVCCNALAIVAAIVMLFLLTGRGARTPWLPVSLALALCTESVTNTLVFSNINGLLLLVLVGFYAALHRDRPWVGGLLLGLAIAIKPLFAPLLFIPFVRLRRHWPVFVGAIGVPVVANLVALATVTGAKDYFSVTVPYLGIVRDYANGSLRGWAVYFGIHPVAAGILWVVLAGCVILGLLALLSIRDTHPVVWMLSTGSLLLTGVFYLSSLGQQYYSIFLFPALATLGMRRSPITNPMALIGFFLLYFRFDFATEHLGASQRVLETLVGPIGWPILILAITTSTVVAALPQVKDYARRSRRPQPLRS